MGRLAFVVQMICLASFSMFREGQGLMSFRKFSQGATVRNEFLIRTIGFHGYITRQQVTIPACDVRPQPCSRVTSPNPCNSFHLSTTARSASSKAVDTISSISSENSKVPSKFVPYPFVYREELLIKVKALTNLGMGICLTNVDAISAEDLENKIKEAQPKQRRKRRRNSSSTNNNELAIDDNLNGPNILEGALSVEEGKSRWVVMVPNVIPGETVRVRIYRNHKSYSDADLVEVLEPSPNRIEPKCSLFEKCGGCQYQHMNIETQREWKRQQMQDCLERIGKLEANSFPTVLPTCGTDEIYNYRSKITPHYDAPERKKKPKEPSVNGAEENGNKIDAIGFKEKASRRIVDVPRCDIATEAINERLKELRNEIHQQTIDGTLKRPHKGATLLLRDANEGVVTDPNQYVTTDVDGIQFRFLAGNFFQNNPHVLPLMVKHVVEGALGSQSKETDGSLPMTHLIDCYCGSGLFCLTASRHFEMCVGIEVNAKAINEARDTAQLNNIENCSFVAASAEAIFESDEKIPTLSDKNEKYVAVRDFPREQTVVVVDPPRKGCSPEFLEQLYAFAPRRVVYMSCDPSTQARDTKGIVANGYRIVNARPFDLFPQTRHIESLIVFEKII